MKIPKITEYPQKNGKSLRKLILVVSIIIRRETTAKAIIPTTSTAGSKTAPASTSLITFTMLIKNIEGAR